MPLIKQMRQQMMSSEMANAIRFLSIDAVERAQSGHPGMPLGMADIATVLWRKFLQHNPKNPRWFNRDRFVLSNGHGSMLLYSILHLTGYALPIEELKQFRQWHSKTPGHPEYNETSGVEATTGPLGQGLANAVGMAIAEKILAAKFNISSHKLAEENKLPEEAKHKAEAHTSAHDENIQLVNHYTYAFVGDGCLMEGISHEACSLAGTLGLGKLIVFYDDNGISIDGPVKTWFSDNTAQRFQAYNWHVIDSVDGHDEVAIEQAILQAREETSKPSLIICKTTIGFCSLQAGSEHTHGAPLGRDDIQHIRKKLNWPHDPFVIPEDIYAQWNHVAQGTADEQIWLEHCHKYQQYNPTKYHEFLRWINGDLPDNWNDLNQDFIQESCLNRNSIATRKASQNCLQHFATILPELLGGSADLTISNNTTCSNSVTINHENFNGNYIHYGVREFAMSAIMNGIALHGGFIPYGGTFLVFSDYARGAIRLSAIMNQRVIYVLTHDSIGLGEDGPTHQPIEQAANLRLIPGIEVWRPASLLETAIAWQQAIEQQQSPSCLLLSRQNLPSINHIDQHAKLISRGGYILYENNNHPTIILIATGSEVHIALEAAKQASQNDIAIRVVSMPCANRFLTQDIEYQELVLPKQVRQRIAIEAGSSNYWYRFVGLDGYIIGLDNFGASAPATELFQHYGITIERTINCIYNFGEQKI